MPDIKLTPLLEAARPGQLRPSLEPFLGPGAEIAVEDTRLQAPLCYWAVYRSGDRWATLKSFFAERDYDDYRTKLVKYYPDRVGQADHPKGGLTFLPEINGMLWGFPFDPVMPGLQQCADEAWIAAALGRRSAGPLHVELRSYRPEIGAILAYREPKRRRVVAYGKAAPEKTCGRIYVVMQRLWISLAVRSGDLRLARPLAFRPEAGLLIQAPVPGKPIGRDRNRRIFLDLVHHAGPALAAIHGADAPFGRRRGLDGLLRHLRSSLDDLAHTSIPLHRSLSQLIGRIESRAGRGRAGRAVPSHGDFKWDQFLESRGRFSLIDFELFCQAEQAFDVGYFCAYLPPSTFHDWRDSAAADMLRSAFLEAYRQAADSDLDLERVGLYEAAMLGIRGLSHVWSHESGWEMRASQMLDLAFERLVNPEPSIPVPVPHPAGPTTSAAAL